ncbi:hypothetical protein [Isoptericola aurantiacus]|uniref:hypothetical protein n=1 Tax=Isoptericola aurantiacus TaxID=3377839 RepID=UPI00383AA8E2
MHTSTALRVVRASAVYDLVATGGFALPWTAAVAVDLLVRLHGAAGLSGTVPPADDPLTVLFANLMGAVVVVWSVVRLRRPTLALGAADTVARALFSLGMVVALTQGATAIVAAFLVVEVGWFAVQGGAVLAAVRTAAASPTLAA